MKTTAHRLISYLWLALVVAGPCLPTPTLAQNTADTGVLRGRVTTANGTALARASVALVGTALTTVTDDEGEFYLANVPAGTREVVVGFLGYPEKKSRVEIARGTATRHDFSLQDETVSLSAMVVFGTREGQARALTMQKNANNLTTVVSSDAVGKFPDAYVGDALRRMVGITVEEDQGEATGITIRGIEPDFNNITINGIDVAAAGTPGGGTSNVASRPIGLDIFSVDLIDSIEVAKATTPEMDGQGLGGAVNVKTKTAFSRGGREIIASGEYTHADLGDGRSGYRASLSYSDIFGPRKQFGALVALTREDRDRRVERVIPQTYNTAGVIQRARANGYNQTLVRTSVLTSFDYKLSDDVLVSFKPSYNYYDDASDYDRAQIHADQRLYQNEYVRDHRTKTLYGLDLSTEVRRGAHELRLGVVYSYAEEDKPENQKHIFRTAQNTINVTFNQDNPASPYPVLSSFQNGVPVTAADKALFGFNEGKFRGNYQDEKKWTWFADYKRDFQLRSLPARLKLGTKYTTTKKFDDAWTYFLSPTSTPLTYNQFPNSSVTRIQDRWEVFSLDKSRMLELFNGPDRNSYFRFNPSGSVDDGIVEDFRAREELAAAYASMVVDIKRLRLEGGVRYERFEGSYVNYGFDQAAFATIPTTGTFPGFDVDPVSLYPNIVKPIPAEGTSSNYFPSLHARYQATRDLIVRSAVSTNVGRPKFTDLAGLARFSTASNPDGSRFTLTTGNASLKPAESISYDLTASYFGFKPLGLLEVGTFYKQIDGRVYSEVALRDATAEDVALYGTAANRLAVGDDIRVVSRGNADRTKIYGAEIDWRMQLYFLPAPLDGFGLGGNYTYSKSEEGIPYIGTLPRNHPSQPARAGQTVSYPKQPNDTANFFVSFQKWGLDARFAGNYTGKNLRQYNTGTATLDQYNSARWRYDVLLTYRFNRSWSLSASVVNLNNEPLVTWEGIPTRVRNSEFLGRTGRLAVRYVFR